jgi:AcrR family transcriptional regulator
MGKGFSEEKKEEIRIQIIQVATELFSQKGLTKTSIDEIIQRVGISKGYFYHFFSSKEELFFTIVFIREQEAHEKVRNIMKNLKKPPKEKFRAFLYEEIHILENDPIFRILIDPNQLPILQRHLTPEKAHHAKEIDDLFFSEFITEWQKEKVMKSISPSIIIGLLKTPFILGLHKTDIGDEIFNSVKDIYIDMLVNYLFST